MSYLRVFEDARTHVQALDVAQSLALTRLAQASGVTPAQLADYGRNGPARVREGSIASSDAA